MARILSFGAYSIYVFDERGQPHHLPHAHIKLRGNIVASVFLYTLEFYVQHERLPGNLVQFISENQQPLLSAWTRLNSD